MESMADVSQGTAEQLALRAQRESKRGEYQSAVATQRAAIGIRERELAELIQDTSALEDERREAAHRLSDYWGRLGGIFRKAGMIPDGIEAYRRGMELERDYQLDDSYNLTNWIVLQLLDNPGRLPELGREIGDAIALVQAQVRGPRRDQWWAWADLGLLRQLGRQPSEARAAYEQFPRCGARRVDYQSVIPVLNSLREAFQGPELTADLSDTIQYLESRRTAL
jgi:hypothetical protein